MRNNPNPDETLTEAEFLISVLKVPCMACSSMHPTHAYARASS